MIAGLVIVPVVSLITAKPEKQLVDNAFSCYEEKVTVRKSQALGRPPNKKFLSSSFQLAEPVVCLGVPQALPTFPERTPIP